MKKILKRQMIILNLFVSLLLSSVPILASQSKFSLSQNGFLASVNESCGINITANNMRDLYGFEIAFAYDPEKVEWVGKPAIRLAEGFTAGPAAGSDKKVYFGFTKVGNKPGETGNLDLGEYIFRATEEGIHKITLDSIKVVKSNMSAEKYELKKDIIIQTIQEISKFIDIKGHWAEACITQIVNSGYMVGKEVDKFAPNDQLTRAEMATILNRIIQKENVQAGSFKDITGEEWYSEGICNMAGQGLLTGYEDGTFRPKKNITRAETLTIMARIEKENGQYTEVTEIDTVLEKYKDAHQIPGWAKADVAWAVEKGIIKGNEKGELKMNTNITRAEATVMLCRLLELEEH